jgi:PAS domain S-box-containing protein
MIDAMDEKVVNAMFETVPVEITVIDANDKVIRWNKHHNRLFYRPEVCMQQNFRECHPQESLPLVEKIVNEMKAGTRNKARFWINLPINKEKSIRHKVLIEFYVLRDMNNNYIGCMECTMDIEELMHLEGERRLIDEK